MSRIRVLADHVANQIAAGEVVDRPASVVKELVENALDAEARRIVVRLETGGRELVAVEDDGFGMDPDDAVLCFDRHATSKLRDSSDLLAIGTLGFRGEALPSIASVARVTLRTRARDHDTGTEVVLRAGKIEKVAPIAWPGGTMMEVRSLFLNTPARRKFLRTEQTELRHVSAMLTRLALARPDVHFRCEHGPRVLLELVPYERKLDRISDLWGPKLARSLTRVERRGGGLELEAFIGPLHDNRSGSDYQQLFVNGRAVRSPVVMASLQDAFHLVLPKGRLPVTVLYLNMPAQDVDVNVHPTKAEVRFHSPATIREFVVRSIGDHLGSGARGMVPEMHLNRDRNEQIRLTLDSVYPPTRPTAATSALPTAGPPGRLSSDDSAPSLTPSVPQSPWRAGDEPAWLPPPVRPEVSSAAPPMHQAGAGPAEAPTYGPFAASIAQSVRPEPVEGRAAGSAPQIDYHQVPVTGRHPLAAQSWDAEYKGVSGRPPASHDTDFASAPGPEVGAQPATRLAGLASLRYIGQLANTFLLLEDDSGLVVVDQHVAHERVRVEELIDGARAGKQVVQPLLMPIPIELDPASCLALEKARDVIEKLGFEVDPIGASLMAVRAAPAALPLSDLDETLRMLARRLQREGGPPPDPAELIEETLVMAACKGAIKAHDPLTPQQVKALLERLDKTRHPFSCPHGRPAYFRLPLQQIEREFGRLGFG